MSMHITNKAVISILACLTVIFIAYFYYDKTHQGQVGQPLIVNTVNRSSTTTQEVNQDATSAPLE